MRLYRLAVRLLPPGFRRRWGASLVEEAESRWRDPSSRGGRPIEALRLAHDLGRSVVREWWDAVVHGWRDVLGGGMASDVRLAARALARTPGFAATVAVTLSLGIGVTTVALGLVDAYLLRSLPWAGGDRLVSVWPAENWSRQMIDRADEDLPVLESLAGAGGVMLVLQEGGEPEELFAARVTPDLHEVLGVSPALGRGFAPEDGAPGAEPVALLSHALWSERFGRDPDVIGRTVALGGDGHLRRRVVGVLPAGYTPLQGSGVDVWVPVVTDPALDEYGDSYFMQAVGRLAPGASLEDADRQVRAWARRMGELEPGWFDERRVASASALSLARQRTGDARTPVLAALGAALLVLLVACANVANLIVARTTARERELSVRAALGAGRARTARTILVEVGVLALVGAIGGFALARMMVAAVERWAPAVLPDGGMEIDPRWILTALALSGLTALVAGLVPGLQAARRDPARALAGGRGTAGGRRLVRIQELLSALQLAMATAGIAAMGLLGRSLLELRGVDPGFAADGSIAFRVTAPPAAYPDDEDVVHFFRDARASLSSVPGVEVAGFGSRLPLAGGDSRFSVTPEGWTFGDSDPRPVAWHRLVTPGYLDALGVRLLEGRIPAVEDDRDDAPLTVVVNRSAARAYWPGESAIGKRFYGRESSVWATVVGVVDDVMENGQASPVLPGVYIPHRDWPWRSMYAVVRTRAGAEGLLPELKEAVWSVSAGVPVSRVETLEAVADRGLRPTRALAVLAAVAGGVALLLGALGVYGVVSHTTARRVREIGVRAALGAGRATILRGEMAGASRIVVTGLLGGLALAWLAGLGLRSLLFGVDALDVPALAVATSLLASVAYLAAWLPARRAASVDPAQVMREA